ncbi:MOSC domain-containing protein [Qipengyuania flava]|nr:MOSC domain-containing protein [Qipengyuania flava]
MIPLPRVLSVAASSEHGFSKQVRATIEVVAGLGVAGDAHAGTTVKHCSRVRVDPTQPNLRQVHLIQGELLAELAGRGFAVGPGDLGENILTTGIDLLALPRASVLAIGPSARLEVTGLRNPCAQIEAFQPGLYAAVLDKGPDGSLIRKAGIMTIVLAGGPIMPDDEISVDLPPPPHHPLERV